VFDIPIGAAVPSRALAERNRRARYYTWKAERNWVSRLESVSSEGATDFPPSHERLTISRSLDPLDIYLVISLRSPRRAKPPRAGLARSSSFLTLLAPSVLAAQSAASFPAFIIYVAIQVQIIGSCAKRIRNISMKSRVGTRSNDLRDA